jgi:heat shock protein HtpX
MIYEEIARNKRNSFFIVFLFFIMVVALGFVIGYAYGFPIFGIAFAGIISFFYILFGYYSGDRAILAMSRAVPATKKEYPHLVNSVEGLAMAAGIPAPKIYVIDDSAINAFATGRDPKHAAITVTKGCIEKLNRAELEGVIAHEMSHVKNYDIRMMMLVVILIGIIALLSDVILRSFLWRRDGEKKGHPIILLIALVLAVLAPIAAQMMRLAISRKREYLADASGALLTRYPQGLADALRKIRDDKEPLVEAANKSTASLFIENPLRRYKGKINAMFSTHPPVNERIKKLEAM